MAASMPVAITNSRLRAQPRKERACSTVLALLRKPHAEELTYFRSSTVSAESVSKIPANSLKGTFSSRERCANRVTTYGNAGSSTVGGIDDIWNPASASSQIVAQFIVPFSNSRRGAVLNGL